MRTIIAIMTGLVLSACLEAQPAPVLDNMGSDLFEIETITESLKKPWAVSVLPKGGYLVTEFKGGLKLIRGDEIAEISGLPEDLFVNGQGGLMGLVLAPDFKRSREVYLSYAYGDKTKNGTGIFKAKLSGNELVNGTTIFRSTPRDTGSHFGGRMAFLPDGSLILTLGDGFAYREEAQNLGNHLGKILRLDDNGSAMVDNPFVKDTNAKAEIYSYGHRNVQGLAFDEATGWLWAHEHGPRGGDELNLIKAGLNYGWPLASTGTDYNGARITPFKDYRGTEAFVYDWVPSIAPSGLVIYRGKKFPDWHGDALVGALKDRSLWRIDLEAGQAIGETRLLGDLNGRVRDVSVDRDGAILVLIEAETMGTLLRVLPKK